MKEVTIKYPVPAWVRSPDRIRIMAGDCSGVGEYLAAELLEILADELERSESEVPGYYEVPGVGLRHWDGTHWGPWRDGVHHIPYFSSFLGVSLVQADEV